MSPDYADAPEERGRMGVIIFSQSPDRMVAGISGASYSSLPVETLSANSRQLELLIPLRDELWPVGEELQRGLDVMRDLVLTVIGDLRLDVRTCIESASFARLPVGHLEYGGIEFRTAGTAFNMATRAIPYFGKVNVVSSVGSDLFTDHMIGDIRNVGAIPYLQHHGDMANGTAVLVRDGSAQAADASRILVASENTPASRLAATFIESVSSVLVESDAVFADGYLLRHAMSRAAVEAAMELCHAHDVTFCLDLLPHDVDRHESWTSISRVLRNCGVVVSGARTLARLLGGAAPYPFNDRHAAELARRLTAAGMGDRRCLVRYGKYDISRSALCHRGILRAPYDTGVDSSKERTSYGDLLTARELSEICRGGL
jgi:sugar/nucleoside kinase (ribokinase family)